MTVAPSNTPATASRHVAMVLLIIDAPSAWAHSSRWTVSKRSGFCSWALPGCVFTRLRACLLRFWHLRDQVFHEVGVDFALGKLAMGHDEAQESDGRTDA